MNAAIQTSNIKNKHPTMLITAANLRGKNKNKHVIWNSYQTHNILLLQTEASKQIFFSSFLLESTFIQKMLCHLINFKSVFYSVNWIYKNVQVLKKNVAN